jgi:hypothetical protein
MLPYSGGYLSLTGGIKIYNAFSKHIQPSATHRSWQSPLFAACVKAALSSPSAACKPNGESKLLTSADFANCSRGTELAQKITDAQRLFHVIQEYMKSVKNDAGQEILSSTTQAILGGSLEVRCVMWALGKRYKNVKAYSDLSDIRKEFVKEFFSKFSGALGRMAKT